MAQHDDKYLEDCAAYGLGALDGEALREFEHHLKSGCTVCSTEMEEVVETSALIPAVLPQVHVPPELKERIMFAARLAQVARATIASREEDTETTSPEEVPALIAPPARRSWLTYGLALSMIVMVAGFGLYVTSLLKTINSQNEFVAQQENRILALTTQLDRLSAIVNVLQSRRVHMVTMDGLTVNPDGYGKIIWDPERKIAILQLSNLPAISNEKNYQLWVMKDQKTVSAGVFSLSDEKEKEDFFKVQRLEIAENDAIDGFAVTLEPKGGVPQPTGETYLFGKLAGSK